MRRNKGITLLATILLTLSLIAGGYLASKLMNTEPKKTPPAKKSLPVATQPKVNPSNPKIKQPIAAPELTAQQFEAIILKIKDVSKLQKEFEKVKGTFKATQKFEVTENGKKIAGNIINATTKLGVKYIFIDLDGQVVLGAGSVDSKISADFVKTSALGSFIKISRELQNDRGIRFAQTAFYTIPPSISKKPVLVYMSEFDQVGQQDFRLKTKTRFIEDRVVVDGKILKQVFGDSVKTQKFQTQFRWNKNTKRFDLLSGKPIKKIFKEEYLDKTKAIVE